MSKRIVSTALIVTLVLSLVLIPVALAQDDSNIEYDTFYLESIGMPRYLDPARAYDTASGEVIFNVLEPLIFFDEESITKFVPRLARGMPVKEYVRKTVTNSSVVNVTWPTLIAYLSTEGPLGSQWDGYTLVFGIDNNGDGELSAYDIVFLESTAELHAWFVEEFTYGAICTMKIMRIKYTFEIRVGADAPVFHNGIPLDTEDVEYTFERGLLHDEYGSPQWMLWKPFYDTMNTDAFIADKENVVPTLPEIAFIDRLIDEAVNRSATHVTFNLCMEFPETAFYQILSQTWGSIVNKEFCTYYGDWDGTHPIEEATFYKYWKTASPLRTYEVICGTGPYRAPITTADFTNVTFINLGKVTVGTLKNTTAVGNPPEGITAPVGTTWDGWTITAWTDKDSSGNVTRMDVVRIYDGANEFEGFVHTLSWSASTLKWSMRLASGWSGYGYNDWRLLYWIDKDGNLQLSATDVVVFVRTGVFAGSAFTDSFAGDITSFTAGGIITATVQAGYKPLFRSVGMWTLIKYDNYWRGWPTPSNPIDGRPRYITTIVYKSVPEWADRRNHFIACSADIVAVPRAYMYDLLDPVTGESKYPNIYTISKISPVLALDAIFYNFEIDSTSPYIGTGSLAGGGGIPTNFFSFLNVRKAFSYAFNHTKYLAEAWYGEAIKSPTWCIYGLETAWGSYRNNSETGYDINYEKAKAALKDAVMNATGGTEGTLDSVWNWGFTMVLTYNTGNDQRRIACEMIRDFFVNMSGDAERSGKPPFTITIVDVDWPTYLTEMEERTLTMFIIGWLADFADCDNFARPFMHTYGDFSYYQSYSNPEADQLIDLAIKTPDGPERRDMYYRLQRIYIEDNPSLPIDQPLGRMWHKRWVKGRYYNPIYPGIYFYHYWKQSTCVADITGHLTPTSGIPDNITNMMDISFICKAYMAYPGHARWNYRCDIVGDRIVNMKDIGTACKHYLHTGPP